MVLNFLIKSVWPKNKDGFQFKEYFVKKFRLCPHLLRWVCKMRFTAFNFGQINNKVQIYNLSASLGALIFISNPEATEKRSKRLIISKYFSSLYSCS